MRFVVLGGGGFVGSHLSERLLELGESVCVFDREGSRYLEYLRKKGADILIGDFLNPEDIRRAIAGGDIVFHLISTTVPKTSNDDPLFDVQTNILGTLRVLDEARKARVERMIFASSGGTVYGIPKEIPITEDHPTDPISSYGIGKLTLEKYFHLYWSLHNIDYRILRISNAYGERQLVTDSQGVIASFLNRVIQNEKLRIWGDGSVIRDYIHVADIVNALIKSAYHHGDLKIFNIGGGLGHSLTDIAGIISKVSGEVLQTEYNPGRLFDVPINVLDISRAKKALNWEPEISLEKGIQRTYQWLLRSRGNN